MRVRQAYRFALDPAPAQERGIIIAADLDQALAG
jgi:hypothetical protein